MAEKGSNASGRMFRQSAMGFNKDDVNTYLDVLTREMSIKLKQKEDEIERLANENKSLKDENSTLKNRQSQVDSEKDAIAKILIRAEENARKILEDAQEEVNSKKAEMQRNYSLESNKLRAIKEEIIELRKVASEAIKKFDSDLANIENNGE